jgi:hypothetical protein
MLMFCRDHLSFTRLRPSFISAYSCFCYLLLLLISKSISFLSSIRYRESLIPNYICFMRPPFEVVFSVNVLLD